jgi:hypothetical protein
MIEVCATLGLFAALSHSHDKPRPALLPAPPRAESRPATRWTPKAS